MILILLTLATLLGAVTSQHCTGDWQCRSLACSSDLGGFCYPKPRNLGDLCYKDMHCGSADIMSICINNHCQCQSDWYESGGECKSSAMWYMMVIVVYTLVPIMVFFTILGIIVKAIRQRQQASQIVGVQGVQVVPTMNPAMGSFPPSITADIEAHDLPPAYSAPPTYSQSQGIPKTTSD